MSRSSETAVTVENLCVSYQIKNQRSLRSMFLGGKRAAPDEIIEAVKNVSFEVPKGQIIGIIGKNGSGKSTLLKTIGGVFSPDSGTVDLHGERAALQAIGIGFKNDLTGRENVYLSGMLMGLEKDFIDKKMDEIIYFSELESFIDKPVRTYSSGMRSKLAFTITAILEADIMLIDEVLSVGDEHFKKKSVKKMKEMMSDEGRTVLIVSHSTSTLEKLCNKVIWLDAGQIKMEGVPKEILEIYKENMK